MNSALVSVGIYRARYRGGDLAGTSIIKLFQDANNIFQAFQTKSKPYSI